MFDLYMWSPSGEFSAYVGSFETEDEAMEFMEENERSGEDWDIRYSGKHEGRKHIMKRAHNRILRHSAEMSPVAPHNADYTGKHESIAEIFADVAEIFAEVCNDLEITAEFIAETVAENTARIRKIAGKLRLPKLPETFSGYRWRSFVSPGLFDMPIIAEGGGKYDVAWNWRG